MKKGDKKAAIELSIGTIVIIVLAMSMLIAGIFLIKNIFSGTTSAVDSINQGVLNEIDELFTDSNLRLAVSPKTRRISIKQGNLEEPLGFAFDVRNNDIEGETFIWNLEVDPQFDIRSKCRIDAREAESWLVSSSGTVNLGAGQRTARPVLVLFTIPEGSPPCTIQWLLTIKKGTEREIYDSRDIFLTVKPA